MPDNQPPATQPSALDELAAATQQSRMTQAERVLQFMEPLCTLYRSPNNDTYVKIRVNGHAECWHTQSGRVAEIIEYLCYTSENVIVSEAVVKQVQHHLTAKARLEGTRANVHKRVAKHDGKLYIDLGNEQWHVLEITPDGVRVLEESPVLFARYEGMLALPEPDLGGSLDELTPLLPTLTSEQWKLIKGFILSCYQPDAPFPILALSGVQGSGKSLLSWMLRQLIDPSVVAHQDVPKRDEDLWTSAYMQRLLAFDNVSDISYHISDELCRISTGSSFVKRKHYEHKTASVITTRNPILLNGVEPYIVRHDLLDRMMQVDLPALDNAAKTEKEIHEQFARLYSRLFGGICRFLQYHVRNQHKQYSVPDVRMRDAVQFVRACCDGNPDAFDFYAAYQESRKQTIAKALDNEPLYILLTELLADGKWSGTSEQLLAKINQLALTKPHLRKMLPSSPHSLGIQLKRVAPFLRQGGIQIIKQRENGDKRTRIIHLCRMENNTATQRKLKKWLPKPMIKGATGQQGQVGQVISLNEKKNKIKIFTLKKPLVPLVRSKPKNVK